MGDEINIKTDYKTPLSVLLSRLDLQEKYIKLINRILKINGLENSLGKKFIVESVEDIINLTPYEFSKCLGVGKIYVSALSEFKNELPYLLSQTIQKPYFISDQIELKVNDYGQPLNLETPLNQLKLSSKHEKLLKRISVLMREIKTIKDIINIDTTNFSKLPSVGITYVGSLQDLQKILSLACSDQTDNDFSKKITKELPSESVQSKLYINYGFLTERETKTLNKLRKWYGKDIDVRNVNALLGINKTDLSKRDGFGRLFLEGLNDLKSKVVNGLYALPENGGQHTIVNRGLFISGETTFIQFNELDNILIEDIEAYLWSLDEMSVDIALSRWGFNKISESLEEVGNRYKITRERIRQLEKKIDSGLLLNFRILPKVLWANIREKMTEDLTVLLPNLAKCFATDKLFFSFIEFCCEVENGSIRQLVCAKIDSRILGQFFCNNQSPVEVEVLISELMSDYGYARAAAINGIRQLKENNKIEITNQGIFPKNLGKKEAAAHALTFHAAGLPWKDIARIVNIKGYSSSQLDEERQAGDYWGKSEYIYLCARGTYRNVIFLELENFNIPSIMQYLMVYFEQRRVEILHLHDYFFQSKDKLKGIEYFALRHIVREHCEEYGMYFDGKSGSDSVSLDPNLKRITQADVILKALNESKQAMTIQEIAERLKSKSAAHARFYINNLIEDGVVVRVDQMVYTTSEKAFASLDVNAITRVVKDVLSTSSAIVEADVFREYINMELNLSYSKYLYAGLVKAKLNELRWHRSNTMFSKEHIPYKNLLDMCKQLCNPAFSNGQNLGIIKQAVWLTDPVATAAINQWRQLL